MLKQWFVEERGIFLPSSNNQTYEDGKDPSYKFLIDGIYIYKSRG